MTNFHYLYVCYAFDNNIRVHQKEQKETLYLIFTLKANIWTKQSCNTAEWLVLDVLTLLENMGLL